MRSGNVYQVCLNELRGKYRRLVRRSGGDSCKLGHYRVSGKMRNRFGGRVVRHSSADSGILVEKEDVFES